MTDKVYTIRKENLKKIVTERFGTFSKFAKIKDIEAAPLYKIQNDQVKMGERAARNYEKLLGLEPYSLDYTISTSEDTYIIPLYEASILANPANIPPKNSKGDISVVSILISNKKLIPRNLIALEINCSSMANTINEGAYVIIDLSNKKIIDGKIYALRISNTVIIRRIFKVVDSFILKADNGDFSETIPNMIDDNFIIGKVEIVLNLV